MSKFGSLAPSDKPYRVEIKDAETGKVIADNSGNVFYIDIYSADSAIGRKFDKDRRSQEFDNARKGIVEFVDPVERNIAKCAALTAAWHLVDPETLEPIDVSCSPANALELYSLPLTDSLWLQPWSAALSSANFIKRSAKSSTPTQSGPSETAEG